MQGCTQKCSYSVEDVDVEKFAREWFLEEECDM
jgi:hypothetical protein